MQVEFRNKALIQLYKDGKSRKYKLPQGILTKFFMRIQQLEAAIDIYDLWKTTSLNFEKLKGFASRYSVRLSEKWRLEFEVEWKDKERTKGNIYVMEISEHYGD